MDQSSPLERQDDEKKTSQERTRTHQVEQYYDKEALVEWQRLERHRTEFAITMRAIMDYLPPTPQIILDDGGGPGRYALALTALGYQVTLLDLSQGNLTLAQQKAQESNLSIHRYVQENALNLSSFHPQSFDAVLLMGPLYHLTIEAERKRAIDEARRVLRPGGLLFATFITRYAAFRDLAKNAPSTLLEKQSEWEEILHTGIYHAIQETGFTDAYFAHPREIEPLMEQAGFETIDLLGCEGVVARNEEQVNQLTGKAWQVWVDFNYQLSREPSLRGAADHLLYIGRKPTI